MHACESKRSNWLDEKDENYGLKSFGNVCVDQYISSFVQQIKTCLPVIYMYEW